MRRRAGGARAAAAMVTIRIPWLRMLMMFLALRGGSWESGLAQIGFVMYNSVLTPVSEALQRRVVLPKLVRAGRVHPSQAARAYRRARLPALAWNLALSAGCAAVLWRAGSRTFVQLVTFSVLGVPVLRALCWPLAWPVPAVVLAIFVGVYKWTGVEDLTVGLLLFHVMPVLAGFAQSVAGAAGRYAVWAAVVAVLSPMVGLALVAITNPAILDNALRNIGEPEYDTFWRYADAFAMFMGVTDSSGENPYKTLGLSNSADDKAVRKRWRELSRRYHPDKLPGGGDIAAHEHFLKLQNAMKLITQGGFDRRGATEVMQERFIGLCRKCVQLLPVVAMWALLAGVALVGALLRYAAARKRAKEAAARSADGADEAGDGAEPDADAERAAEGVYKLGADFVGASAFGIGGTGSNIVPDIGPEDADEYTTPAERQRAAASASVDDLGIDESWRRPAKGALSGLQGSQVVGGQRRGTARGPRRRR